MTQQWLLFTLLLACGCVSAPAYSVRTIYGTAYGGSQAEAEELAVTLQKSYVAVSQALPGVQAREVSLWMQERLQFFWGIPMSEKLEGICIDFLGRIQVRSDCLDLKEVVVHELVHHLLGDSWSVLPPVMEEGLADCVVCHLSSGVGSRLKTGRLLQALRAISPVEAQLLLANNKYINMRLRQFYDNFPLKEIFGSAGNSIAPSPWSSDLHEHSRGFYGLGFFAMSRIIDRHGYQGLHRACVQTKSQGLTAIPAAELMQLAALGLDPEQWRKELIIELSKNNYEGFLVITALSFAKKLLEFEKKTVEAAGGPEEYLDQIKPRFQLKQSSVTITLDNSPEFRKAFVRAYRELKGI